MGKRLHVNGWGGATTAAGAGKQSFDERLSSAVWAVGGLLAVFLLTAGAVLLGTHLGADRLLQESERRLALSAASGAEALDQHDRRLAELAGERLSRPEVLEALARGERDTVAQALAEVVTLHDRDHLEVVLDAGTWWASQSATGGVPGGKGAEPRGPMGAWQDTPTESPSGQLANGQTIVERFPLRDGRGSLLAVVTLKEAVSGVEALLERGWEPGVELLLLGSDGTPVWPNTGRHAALATALPRPLLQGEIAADPGASVEAPGWGTMLVSVRSLQRGGWLLAATPRSAVLQPLVLTDLVFVAVTLVLYVLLAAATVLALRGYRRNRRLLQQLRGHSEKLESLVEERTADLTASKARLSAVFDAVADGILVLDAAGVVTQANAASERILGSKRAELVGRRPGELWRRCGLAPKVEGAPSHEEEPDLPDEASDLECLLTHAGGEEAVLLVSVVPLYDQEGKGSGRVISFSDVTARRQAEEALRESEKRLLQAQKMEAVGRLAGGVAHDFNNLLTVITGATNLLLRTEANDSAREELHYIHKAAEKATSLTRQLLAFGRRQIMQPRILDLNESVRTMERMLRRVIGENIDLVTRLGAEVGPVRVDPGQLEQIIVNLALNARDAMPTGGRLTIETEAVAYEEAISLGQGLEELPAGRYAVLRVADTGQGMDGETLARLFEPFFTTKTQGNGTGLGLATVYGIVQQSGGQIQVRSRLGEGSTFSIFLPEVREQEDERQPGMEEGWEQTAEAAEGTILVVEDEETVRSLLARALRMEGYTVLEAGDGLEAFEVAERQGGGEIDLLVTDVIMPRMGGGALAERLLARRGDLKVLYMSGYTENDIVRRGELVPGTSFLQKPFPPELLTRRVRALLEAR